MAIDYSEGTWEPSLGGTAVLSAFSGTWTKIGRLVTLNGSLTITTIGTGSTSQIAGCPFSAVSPTIGSVLLVGGAVSSVSVGCYISTDDIVLFGRAAAAASDTIPLAALGNGVVINFTITFEALGGFSVAWTGPTAERTTLIRSERRVTMVQP